MRNLLVFLTLIFASISIKAQEHLSFKGIPIEGSMTDFCQKLKAKGFIPINQENNLSIFSGDFTGRKAMIGVAASADGKNVHGVVVLFDSCSEWKTLVNTYNHYKELYSQKYGSPTLSKEDNPSRSDTNISLMYELNQGTVVYGSIWEVTGGEIELSIDKSSEHLEGSVKILYRDAQNVKAKIQNDLDEI